MRNVSSTCAAMLPLLALGSASCSKYGPFATCPEGSSISDRALVERAVRKLVVETGGEIRPGRIRYRSVAEFFARNPDCCFITQPRDYAGREFSLPFDGEVEIAIRYRRAEAGDTPYALRYVAVGACTFDMEEGVQPLTASQFEASKTWRWNWRVR